MLSGIQLPGKPEIRDLDVETVVQQDVLGLEVAVHHVPAVDVCHALEHLPHDVAGLLLREGHHRREVVEELAVLAQLEHQEDEGARFEHVLEFNWEEERTLVD